MFRVSPPATTPLFGCPPSIRFFPEKAKKEVRFVCSKLHHYNSLPDASGLCFVCLRIHVGTFDLDASAVHHMLTRRASHANQRARDTPWYRVGVGVQAKCKIQL